MDIRMTNIATPMPQLRAKFTSKLGIPLSGCKVYTYEPNSDILKKTWLDIDKTVENTNPILLDAAGEADMFLDGLYRVVVKDRFGFVVYDVEKTGTHAEWDASFVVDASGQNQQQINNETVYSSRFGNLSEAEQHAFTQNKTLHVNNSNSLDSPITFRVDVEFTSTGEIIQNGNPIIFNKNIKAGRYQIFKGDGGVTAFKCEEAFSDWFGAVADGYTYSIDNVNTANNTYTVNGTSYAFGVSPTVTYTDATAALQKTIDLGAKKTVITDSGNSIYMIDTQNWLKFVGKFKRELVLEGQLKAIPSNAFTGTVLLIQDVLKCKVIAKSKIVGNLLEHDLLNSSEYIHGCHIANAVDSDFIDLETEFHVGDGSYVAYVRSGDWLDTSKYTKNIRFNGGSHNYNRRTGHVIEIGNHIYHKNVNYDNNGVIRGTGIGQV